MALKDTVKTLRNCLEEVLSDLEKAEGGNKAASQRVRTGTICLEKCAKVYRKESVKAEKGAPRVKKAKPAKAAKKAPAKKKAHVKPKAMSVKRPTARVKKKR